MFKVLKYAHDQVTDSIEIKVLYCTKPNGTIHPDGGFFSNKYSGDNWLYRCKRDYFLFKQENFLMHKKHIIENSPGHKSLTDKKNILDRLLFRYHTWACTTATLTEACKYFLRELENFEKIIPNRKNPSYDSSCNELKELTEFAQNQTKQ